MCQLLHVERTPTRMTTFLNMTVPFTLIFLGWANPKTMGMPVGIPSARYSLVKGKRIVRSVMGTWLSVSHSQATALYPVSEFRLGGR